MPVEQDQPITIAPRRQQIEVAEKTGNHATESYFGVGTGEGVFGDRITVERPRKSPGRPAVKGKAGQAHPFPPAEARRAYRAHWMAAQAASESLLQAAEDQDLMGVGIAADNLDQSLAELWKLREGRDIDWQTILNHMQGMMRTFFLEKRAERLTAEQCKRIVELVKDYLGPATKTVDDLNEVLRLIEDAGFDPYAAISGDPLPDQKE